MPKAETRLRISLNKTHALNIRRCLRIRIDEVRQEMSNPTRPHGVAESAAELVDLEQTYEYIRKEMAYKDW